jgi:hypothetical protein
VPGCGRSAQLDPNVPLGPVVSYARQSGQATATEQEDHVVTPPRGAQPHWLPLEA